MSFYRNIEIMWVKMSRVNKAYHFVLSPIRHDMLPGRFATCRLRNTDLEESLRKKRAFLVNFCQCLLFLILT